MIVRRLDPIVVPLAFVLALGLTRGVRSFARGRGIVARPKGDRWHKQDTALLGGVAIFTAVALIRVTLIPGSGQALVVLGAGAWLFLVGLVDDFRHLKPYQKVVGQLMGAMPVISCGMTLSRTGSPALDMAITIFWLVGITNAINLLDNMDGLAAGVAMIASIFLALHFWINGFASDALTLAVFAAALLGFLAYNAHPATIFMGDCGSMFIGSFLAGAALLHPVEGRSRSFLPALAVPVLILFIPILETIFVVVLRKLAGRAASQGGRDHTSHRLVALGLSERRAVWMLQAFAIVSGLLGLLVRNLEPDVSLAAILGFTILLTLLGVHLAEVKCYDDAELRAARDQRLVAFLVDISYKRRVFEVLLDVLLIILSYYTAFALVFGPIAGASARSRFLQTVTILVFVKTPTFLVMGVYRGLWRYFSLEDLVHAAQAVLVGSVAGALAILLAYRFEGLSRVVFVLDGLIFLILVTGSRVAFRLFRILLPTPMAGTGHRVLIYGAGDAGELLARQLLNNPSPNYVLVGFADDDPLKLGKVIHGLRVLGGNGSFREICVRRQVEEVLISSSRFPSERIWEIIRDCELANVRLKRMRIQLEHLGQESFSDAARLNSVPT